MRIAQLASLFVPVPPPRSRGTERVVSRLTEELVRHGHRVTLFASGDSDSHRQRRPLPRAHWRATVYNGVDVAQLPFSPDKFPRPRMGEPRRPLIAMT